MKSLSRLLTVFRREMAAYFNAAIAYIFIIVFVLLNGGLYMTQFFVVGRADMRAFFITPILRNRWEQYSSADFPPNSRMLHDSPQTTP